MDWNVIWVQSLAGDLPGGLIAPSGKTVCFPVHVRNSGSRLRFRFSNRRGARPYTIDSLTVVKEGEIRQVLSGGKKEIQVPVGEEIYTDELEISVKPGDELQIRLFMKEKAKDVNNSESEVRYCKNDATWDLDAGYLREIENNAGYIPSLDRIELYTEEESSVILIFGDSITAMARWTRPLAGRLYEAYGGKYTLLNAGINGNGLLTDWKHAAIQYRLASPMFGEPGKKRFEKDVLSVPGLHTVVFSLGVNDVANMRDPKNPSLNAENFLKTLGTLAGELKERNIRTGIQLITPFQGSDTWSPEKEEERRKINRRILAEAGEYADFILDFNRILERKDEPAVYDELHQGDHVHPNVKAGRLMAESVDLARLTGEELPEGVKSSGKTSFRSFKHIPIWGETVPGNSHRRKTDFLDVGKKQQDMILMMHSAMAMPGKEIKDAEKSRKGLDTYQYWHEINTGFRPKTFEDIPVIDYYPCKWSEKSVLIIPGGGFTYQSDSGVEVRDQYEGGAVALRLNKAGFAAFVLSRYRLNPYRMPVPLLDAQRAVRFIRYHADKLHIDPDQLGIMGFSAGGYLAASVPEFSRDLSPQQLLRDAGMDAGEYDGDKIDKTQAQVAFAGLVYPMLSFNANVPMMYAAFPKEDVDDPGRREELLKEYDLTRHVRPGDPPQFIVMGTKDTMVDLTDDKTRYMQALKDAGVDFEYLPVKGAGHGFGVKSDRYNWWIDRFIDWVRSL